MEKSERARMTVLAACFVALFSLMGAGVLQQPASMQESDKLGNLIS